ncbi:Apolipoprotein L3 [Merluccius polli]|uniref:Apolipoprotein L3 n=1 Tax=Merluccius polli TaxID=89951 RepID=A0AA47MK45_MERPO|nr:Apolipoprotein L3 [Merluccius polli]
MLSSGSKHEKELATVLKNTLEGIEKLTFFLDAVEKLAATSLHVFTGGEEVVKLSLGICLKRVKDSISAARLVCPLLLQFKRDAGVLEMVYLFQEKSTSGFVNQFSECHARMLQFLDDMEASAIQLDRMKLGSKISSVAGSSVGTIGGVLTIVGLALAPVTAGVSLGLTASGLGLAATSGVNSAVTTATEIAVNKAQQTKASEGIQSFMQDVNIIQACLDEVTNQREKETLEEDHIGDVIVSHDKIGGIVECTIERGVGLVEYCAQAGVKGPAALSKTVRAGFIAVNALFIGLDVYVICKESISLAKGDTSEISQFIRARAALLRSELNTWHRMHESLNQGMLESEKGKTILEQMDQNFRLVYLFQEKSTSGFVNQFSECHARMLVSR